jgi:Uma2 family endonuclease
MKALILHVTDEELTERHRRGLDHFDEMWQGVLHMAPAPAYEHQRIVSHLDRFLGALCDRHKRGVLALGINVFDEASKVPDYRIPDFTFVAAGHEHLLVTDGVRGGGPEAVIEVRSPDDETYEKLPFFVRIGVSEVIVIDRDTKRPKIYRLAGSQYVAVQPDRDGWLGSEALHVRFTVSPAGRLVLEDADDSSVRTEI